MRRPAPRTVLRRDERSIVGNSNGGKECNSLESQRREGGVAEPELGKETSISLFPQLLRLLERDHL